MTFGQPIVRNQGPEFGAPIVRSTGAPAWGELYSNDNSTAVALPTPSSWVVISTMDTIGDFFNMEVDAVNNRLVCQRAGIYWVQASISFSKTIDPPDLFEITVTKNGTPLANMMLRRRIGSASIVGVGGLHGIVRLVVGDYLDLAARDTDGPGAGDIVVEHANLVATMQAAI